MAVDAEACRKLCFRGQALARSKAAGFDVGFEIFRDLSPQRDTAPALPLCAGRIWAPGYAGAGFPRCLFCFTAIWCLAAIWAIVFIFFIQEFHITMLVVSILDGRHSGRLSRTDGLFQIYLY